MTHKRIAMFRNRAIAALLVVHTVTISTHTACAADDGATAAAAQETHHVDPPKRVEFRLRDDVKLTGELSSWDRDGIDGTFGRRLWTELKTDDAWTLHVYFMDHDNAAHWVNLGRIMLLAPKGEDNAARAFKRAVALDPKAEKAVEAARAWAAEETRKREEAKAQAESAKLRTNSPEAGPWTGAVWPELTAEDRFAETLGVKRDAEEILAKAGLKITPVETDWFVLYSDAPRPDAAMWVIRLERAYRRLARLFNIHSSQNVFVGKAVVFVFTDHDRFRVVEAEAFNQLVPRESIGLCHYDGPRVFMCFHQNEDPDALLWRMLSELTHAFMHRLQTDVRLPAWANEGLAEMIAAQEMQGTLTELDRRGAALSFIRDGGNVFELLDRSYDDFDWTPRWEGFRQVSGLIVELMIKDRPAPFRQWVEAVKRGKPWREALVDNFGIEAREIIDTSIAHYKVND